MLWLKKKPNRLKPSNCGNSLSIINTLNLSVSSCYQSSLVSYNCPIFITLIFKNHLVFITFTLSSLGTKYHTSSLINWFNSSWSAITQDSSPNASFQLLCHIVFIFIDSIFAMPYLIRYCCDISIIFIYLFATFSSFLSVCMWLVVGVFHE